METLQKEKILSILNKRQVIEEETEKTAQVEIVKEKDIVKKVTRSRWERQNDFLKAFVVNMGLRYKSCNMAGIRYATLKEWEKDPKFKIKFDEVQQQVNEQAEASLLSKFRTNSPVPEIFYLRSRDPRYSQRVTLEGNENAPITITHDEKTIKAVTKAITEMMKGE